MAATKKKGGTGKTVSPKEIRRTRTTGVVTLLERGELPTAGTVVGTDREREERAVSVSLFLMCSP